MKTLITIAVIFLATLSAKADDTLPKELLFECQQKGVKTLSIAEKIMGETSENDVPAPLGLLTFVGGKNVDLICPMADTRRRLKQSIYCVGVYYESLNSDPEFFNVLLKINEDNYSWEDKKCKAFEVK